MSFEIPNDPAAPVHPAAFADQAEPDAVDWDILVAALKGDGVISGCAVTAQGTPDMTVAVASGTVIIAGATVAVSGGNVTITAADGTNPRFDLVVVNNAGTKSAVAGSPNANACLPAIPASSVVLAAIYVPAADTDIDANQIIDKRAFPLAAPIQNGTYIYAADSVGTDAYAITLAPAPAAYAAGQAFNFKAGTANTGAATLNVNGLGAKTILKQNDTALATGDIEAGQIVTVVYDGTNFQMLSQLASTPAGGGGTVFLTLLAGDGRGATTDPCDGPLQVEAGTNDVDYIVLDFDTAADENAIWVRVLPPDYAGGTLSVKFIWTAGSGSGTVKWMIKARAYADDAAIDQAYGTAVGPAADTLLAAGDVHITDAVALTVGGTPTAGQPVMFKVYRDVSEDTLAVDARLIAIIMEE